ncbi:MAG: hypothetical protein Q8J93_04050 [Xanthomonadales bacterium]|nr:hypothetical protein [Xanthomonadales bacterium]MDZ4117141.1 hypothetical protein [Xanthomonadaceae bacterium]
MLISAQHSTAQHSTAQHSTAQHSTAQHSTAQHSTAQHSRYAGLLACALVFTVALFGSNKATAALNPDTTDFVICNACSALQRTNAATAAIPRDGNEWTIVVFDENTYATSSYVGFREYDRELRRTFSAIYETANDIDAIEAVQVVAQIKANLNAARSVASPSSVMSVDGVVKGAVPAGILPIVIPPEIDGISTASAINVRSDDLAGNAVSKFVTIKMNKGVVFRLNLVRILRKILGKAIKDVTVVFSDGSTMMFKYNGIESNPLFQWEPIFESIDGIPGSGSGGGGGSEGGGGGGGSGGGFTFFRVCVSGTVSFPGGVSQNFVCFLTLTP